MRLLFLFIPWMALAQTITVPSILFVPPSGGGGSSVTVKDTVFNTAEDAESEWGDENSTSSVNYLGLESDEGGGGYDNYGLRFNLAIPQGAIIESCKITWKTGGSNNTTGSDILQFSVYNVGNCAAFSDAHTHDLSAHASVASTSVDKACQAGTNTVMTYTGLESVLQQAVNHAAWESGNYAGFYIHHKVGSFVNGHYMSILDISLGISDSEKPSIEVTYH